VVDASHGNTDINTSTANKRLEKHHVDQLYLQNDGADILQAEGVTTVEEIDIGMCLGCNHPIGPLALADLIGLDVCLIGDECVPERFRRLEIPCLPAASRACLGWPSWPEKRLGSLSIRIVFRGGPENK
jgi:hypothetical protein